MHSANAPNRADIYALGVVFYQMLTGELPGKPLVPPSRACGTVQIDVRLDEVVLRALEKKPELRYQQVSEVKTMVETIASTPPSSKQCESPQFVAATPRQDWWTWWYFQSPEAGQICAHLTKEERKHLLVSQFLYSVWVMATIFGIPALNRTMHDRTMHESGDWIVSAVWAGLFIVSLPMIYRMMRHFFCSTDWARKQGITPDKLRLFSFSAMPGEARGTRPIPKAKSLVTAPSITMMIASGFNITGLIFGLFLTLIVTIFPASSGVRSGHITFPGLDLLHSFLPAGATVGVTIAIVAALTLVWLAGAIVTGVGGLRMLQLRHRRLAIAGAIILIVAGLFGVVFNPLTLTAIVWAVSELGAGIWAMVVLLLPDVQKDFAERELQPTKSRGSTPSTPANRPASLPPPRPLPFAAAAVIAFVVWLLITMSATVVTFIMPESYASTASIRVERDKLDTSSGTQPTTYDPYFLATEFEVIQSQPILSRVIDDLHLNQEWGKKYGVNGEPLHTDQTLAMMKGRMSLRPVRNTSLIEIQVFSDQPDEAARIANAIAEAYKSYRAEESAKLAQFQRKTLDAQLERADTQLSDARRQLARLQKELAVPDDVAQRAYEPAEADAKQAPFWKQKRQLEDLLRFRNELSSRFLSETADNALPGIGQVEIVNRAAVNPKPVRPNKPLNIFFGAVIGALAGLAAGGLVLLIGGLRRARIPVEPGPGSSRAP